MGNVSLGGALWVGVDPFYEPAGGETFEILTTTGGGVITGSFAEIIGPGVEPDTFEVAYNPDSVVLTLVNPPEVLTFEDGFESGDTSAWSVTVP